MNKLVICLFILLFTSCADYSTEVPYIISSLESKCTANNGYYSYAGIEFDFFNSSEKTISKIIVSCYVYSAIDKKNPLVGSNQVSSYFSDSIREHEKKHLAISLDNRIHEGTQTPYLIDFFTVTKIEFSDGSSWEDRVCQFYTRSY